MILASQERVFPLGFVLALLALSAGCGADGVVDDSDERIANKPSDQDACADCQGDADFAPEASFACSDGHAIPTDYVCDGLIDCVNGEDESELTCPTTADDASTGLGTEPVYVCRDGLEIDVVLHCDGVADCAEGEDEFYCSSPDMPEGGDQGFVCADSPYEYGPDINDGWVCDGFLDCPLGDDEEGCPVVACDADAGVSDGGTCGDAGIEDAGY